MNASATRLGRLMPFALLSIWAMIALAGCSSVRVTPMSQDKFPPPKPKDYEMRLFISKIQTPHREIAWIDSQPLLPDDPEAENRQLLQIQKKACRIGADAVHDMKLLEMRVRGFTVDERVPFRAYKQGRYTLRFWRGTALVYSPPGENVPATVPASVPETSDTRPSEAKSSTTAP